MSHPGRNVRWLTALFVGVTGLILASLATPGVAAARAAYTATIVNFDAAGRQVTRYDTAGNAIDAHDGVLATFGGRYYLYGTSYDCGYGLNTTGTRFCGFRVYESSDLVHWADRGAPFNPNGSVWQSRCAPPKYGCYRPHVVYNATTARYLLWVNAYDNRSGYHVFAATAPTGPFTELAEPTLAVQGTAAGFNNGDMDVFVDDDGTAYLAYTDIRANHDQIIEKLNAAYTSGTGSYVRLGVTSTEAPSLFRRGDVYYHVSGPNCPYCGGVATQYRVSSTGPLGTWSVASTVNSNSCGGQPSFVARLGSTYLYGSDLWSAGAANQALANYYWAPLSFASGGGLNAFGCVNSVTLALDSGSAGSQLIPADLDQADGVVGFRCHCDIGGNWQRMQTFVAGRTATLTSASYTTFQKGNPNAPLLIDIYQVNAALQKVGAALATVTVPASGVGWSPRTVSVAVNVAVTAGTRYGILVRSTTTAGCYGLVYNDSAPYPGGGEAYSANGGSTFTAEANRSSKFYTAVGGPNLARAAAVSTSSSYEGGGWGTIRVNDGRRTSDTSSMGWSSNATVASNHTESVRLDFAAARTVSRVDLYPRQDVGNIAQAFPVDFTIEVSADANTWTPVLTRTGYSAANGAGQSFPFTATSARYLRIRMTGLSNANPNDATYRAQFAEVEAY